MDLLDQKYLWASCLWGAIAGGYMLYGWRQRSAIPFLGGAVMTGACFFATVPMTLICIATLVVVHWLLKQGY